MDTKFCCFSKCSACQRTIIPNHPVHCETKIVLTIPHTTNFRLFQTETANDNFKFDENGRKLSKWVENTVEKGEIARHEQFLLFPQCFLNVLQTGKNQGLFGKGLNDP